MVSTPTRSTVSTIAKSLPLRNILKTKAEATVKKLNVENTIANFWPTSPIADSPQQPATKKNNNCRLSRHIGRTSTKPDNQHKPELLLLRTTHHHPLFRLTRLEPLRPQCIGSLRTHKDLRFEETYPHGLLIFAPRTRTGIPRTRYK